MTCTCRKEITEKLLARFKEQSPEATGHTVSLSGYTLVFGGNTLAEKGYMPIAATASFPLKKGGFKEKKKPQNMVFTYCPFCGVKYDQEKNHDAN